MKTVRLLIASVALTIFNAVMGGLLCGGIFNWVYKLEPTNVWKSAMNTPPGIGFFCGELLLSVLLVLAYVLLSKGIPVNGKLLRGVIFGLCVWAVGMLPGMFATYYFMTVAPQVIVYWTISGMILLPVKGLIIAAIYGE